MTRQGLTLAVTACLVGLGVVTTAQEVGMFGNTPSRKSYG